MTRVTSEVQLFYPDAGSGRNPADAKGNIPTPPLENGTSKAPLVTLQETKKSLAAAVSKGPSGITSPSNNPVLENLVSASGCVNQSKSTSNAGMSKSDLLVLSSDDDDDDDDDDDCIVLDGNPEKPVMVWNDGNDDSDDMVIVAEKGEFSCRDFCHSRHLCVKFPFASTPHRVHCSQCYCYACDSPAPCTHWGTSIATVYDHCHASDKEEYWRAYRRNLKETR